MPLVSSTLMVANLFSQNDLLYCSSLNPSSEIGQDGMGREQEFAVQRSQQQRRRTEDEKGNNCWSLKTLSQSVEIGGQASQGVGSHITRLEDLHVDLDLIAAQCSHKGDCSLYASTSSSCYRCPYRREWVTNGCISLSCKIQGFQRR